MINAILCDRPARPLRRGVRGRRRFGRSARFRSAEPISADTLEEITQSLLRSGSTHGVVASHPGFQIRRALVEAGRPSVVVR